MKPVVIGALVVAAFIGGVLFFKHDWSGSRAAVTRPSAAAQVASEGTSAAGNAGESPHDAKPPVTTSSSQVPSDARLAALAVSPDNGLIEFVRAPDGKVIAEIDNDPGSPGFRKPSREYLYSGNKVVGLTAYRYFADHVEINRTSVSYKPDGSVDDLAESTSIENGKRK
jgi:hypothetical protein